MTRAEALQDAVCCIIPVKWPCSEDRLYWAESDVGCGGSRVQGWQEKQDGLPIPYKARLKSGEARLLRHEHAGIQGTAHQRLILCSRGGRTRGRLHACLYRVDLYLLPAAGLWHAPDHGLHGDYWNTRGLTIALPSFGYLSDRFGALEENVRQRCERLAAHLKRGEAVTVIVDSSPRLSFDRASVWYVKK